MPVIETKVVSGVTYEKFVEPQIWMFEDGVTGLRAFAPPAGNNGAIAVVYTLDATFHTATGAVYVWANEDDGADDGSTIILPTGWTSDGRWLRLIASA